MQSMKGNRYAQQMIDFANQFEENFGVEHSFKMVTNALYSNRFLLCFHRRALGENPLQRLFNVSSALNMPQAFVEDMHKHLPAAEIFHLGFEQQEDKSICKLYLDFLEPIKRALRHRHTHTEPVLIHLAYKWNANNPKQCTKAFYRCNKPLIRAEEISQQLTAMYSDCQERFIHVLAQQFVTLCAAKMAGKPMFFMEVEEPGNPRYSYDINVYDGRVKLEDAETLIAQIADYLTIPSDYWKQQIAANHGRKLGHLSGGIDRRDREFFTMYFGITDTRPGELSLATPKL